MNKMHLILEGLQTIVTNSKDGKKFKNKQELVDFVKTQLNVELENDATNTLNKKRNILYTEIPSESETPIYSLLHKYGIRYEKHLKQYYWIWVK